MCYPGLPTLLSCEESACQCRKWRFCPWVGKIPCRRKWQPLPVFLPGKSNGQKSLVGCSLWGHNRGRHDLATKQQCIIIYKTFDTDKIIESLFRILFSQNWLIALVVIFNLLYLISLPFFIFPFCLPRYWDDGREQELVFYNTPQPGSVASFPQVKPVFKNNCVSGLTSFSQPVIRRCTMSACPLVGVHGCCPWRWSTLPNFPSVKVTLSLCN